MRLIECALVLVVCLALSACASPEQQKVEPGTPELGTYTQDQIEERAALLLNELEVGDELHVKIMNRLGEMLSDPTFAPKLEDPGVNAVGAFQYGGGGLIVRGGAGNALMDFSGGSPRAAYDAKGWSVGASAGGENNFGVLLAVGLRYEEHFTDNYRTQGTSGAAGETGYAVGSGTPERNNQHTIRYCATSIGLGGSAGTGRVTITPAEGGDEDEGGE